MREHARPVVLLVDGDPHVRDAVGVLLSAEDFEVVALGEADEARRRADDLAPDLVIVDVPFAGAVAGLAVVERFGNHAGLPVVVMTTRNDIRRLLQGFRHEAVVWKPFAVDDLTYAVERALGRRR